MLFLVESENLNPIVFECFFLVLQQNSVHNYVENIKPEISGMYSIAKEGLYYYLEFLLVYFR